MSEFKPVLLALPSLTPSLAIEILPYGLIINKIIVQPDGRTHDLLIGPELPQHHLQRKYVNTIIGRYANRIPVGKHAIERNGIQAEVTAIANEGDKVSLHGGPTGFDALPWEQVDKPTLFTATELSHLPGAEESTAAVFRLVSPDGDQGFPGKLIVEALVALIGPGTQERKFIRPGDHIDQLEFDLGSVVLVYRAKLDSAQPAVTPVNLTQHWGFNLTASLKDGPESLSIKDHLLTIKADNIVDRDEVHLSKYSYLPVANTPHAHVAKPIGQDFPGVGYDDYYLLSKAPTEVPKRFPVSSLKPDFDLLKDVLRPTHEDTPAPRGQRGEPVVELSSPKSGLKIIFDTNQSGLMFYSNIFSDASEGYRKRIHGGSGEKGDGYGPQTAAFLEFHDPLAAFLDPSTKNGDDTLLTSDEIYNNYVRMDVKFKQQAP
ncbi:hypothetical protein HGRIS_004483 [Hohenbuehelia grisea]|uniref:Galactose mutarotase-like protein n=1 Tax=Hohenbuehelia grisea TaxID=104357 RepID=A0ABR3JDP5_9AGAR